MQARLYRSPGLCNEIVKDGMANRSAIRRSEVRGVPASGVCTGAEKEHPFVYPQIAIVHVSRIALQQLEVGKLLGSQGCDW